MTSRQMKGWFRLFLPVPKTEAIADVDIKYGYCTEFIIMLEKKFSRQDELEFKAYLESIGDSIVCVAE